MAADNNTRRRLSSAMHVGVIGPAAGFGNNGGRGRAGGRDGRVGRIINEGERSFEILIQSVRHREHSRARGVGQKLKSGRAGRTEVQFFRIFIAWIQKLYSKEPSEDFISATIITWMRRLSRPFKSFFPG